MNIATHPPSNRRRILRQVAGGGFALLAGALVGWTVAELAPANALEGLGWADWLALLVAAMLLASGVFMTVAATRKDWLQRVMQTADPLGATDLADMRLQGAIILGSAVLLAIPPFHAAAGAPAPALTYALMMPLLAAHSLLNLRLWRRADELFRRVIVESAAVCFWVLQLALFTYAAAERLGLLTPLTAWQAVSVMMAVYLLVSAWIGIRRGLS